MKKARPKKSGSSAPHGDDHAAVIILMTLADTTWRIFVPVIIFASLGIWGDIKLQKMPWLTLTGVVIGFIIAGLLIRDQLKKVAESEKKKET